MSNREILKASGNENSRNSVLLASFQVQNKYLWGMLSIALLILVSLLGTAGTVYFFRRNLIRIRENNKKIESKSKRILNYPLTVLWYGYLLVFFVGLSVNTLIFD